MNKVVLAGTLASMLLAASFAAAQPKAVVVEPTYDFGQVTDITKPVENIFVLRNEGTETLVISNVRCSCGCTAPTLAEEDKNLPPGEEVEIPVAYRLPRRDGQASTSCTISTNDPENPQLTITFTGEIQLPVSFDPPTVNFGRITGTDTEPRTVTIRSREGDFEVTDIDVNLEQIQTELKEVEPGRVFEVTATIVEPLPTGTNVGRLNISTTHPEQPQVSITLYAQSIGALDVQPPSIAFRQTEGGLPLNRIVSVRPGAVKDFEVTGVIAPAPGIGVEIMAPANRDYVQIRLSDIPSDDTLEGKELIITTNTEEAPELRVPFHPIAVQQAAGRRTAN